MDFDHPTYLCLVEWRTERYPHDFLGLLYPFFVHRSEQQGAPVGTGFSLNLGVSLDVSSWPAVWISRRRKYRVC